MLDLSIFHIASGHANEITQTQSNQSIKKRPEGYRDMVLFACISIELLHAQVLEIYSITLPRRFISIYDRSENFAFIKHTRL